MKKTIICFLACLSIISCKDSSGDLPDVAEECKIIEFEGSNQNYNKRTKFEYDAKGRVVRIIGEDTYEGLEVFDFSYSPNKVIVKRFKNNHNSSTYIYTLNNDGLVSGLSIDGEESKSTYTYSNRYLIQASSRGYDPSNMFLSWENGNLTNVIYKSSDGFSQSIFYNASKDYQPYTNSFLNIIGPGPGQEGDIAMLEMGYYGRLPKNQVTSTSYKFDSDHSFTNCLINYTTAADGKVTGIESIQGRGGTYKSNVKYNCN